MIARPRLRLTLPGALRHRNFKLFFGAQFLSLIGTFMQSTALAWLVYSLSRSPLMLGTVAVASALPGLVFTVLGGALADRHSKRLLLLGTQSAACVLAFVLAWLVLSGRVRIEHVMVLSFLLGIATAVDTPTRQAFIIDLVGRDDLPSGIALNSSVFNATRVIGPAAAGVCVGLWGTGVCFLINGVSFVAPIASLLLVDVAAAPAPPADRSVAREIHEALAYVWRTAAVRDIILTLACSSLGWGGGVLYPVFARDVLQAGPEGFGFLMATTGVGAVCGALALSVSRPVSADVLRGRMVGGILVFATATTAFAWSRAMALSLPLLVVAGAAMIVYFASSNTWLQTLVPDGLRGRVLGVYHSMFQCFMPLGSLLAGALAQHLGAPIALTLAAATCALVAAVAGWRRIGAEPAAASVAA